MWVLGLENQYPAPHAPNRGFPLAQLAMNSKQVERCFGIYSSSSRWVSSCLLAGWVSDTALSPLLNPAASWWGCCNGEAWAGLETRCKRSCCFLSPCTQIHGVFCPKSLQDTDSQGTAAEQRALRQALSVQQCRISSADFVMVFWLLSVFKPKPRLSYSFSLF